MWLKFALDLVGGVRAAIFLGLFLGTLVLLGVANHGKTKAEESLEAVRTALAADKAKYEVWKGSIETNHAEALLAIERKWTSDNDEIQKELDRLNADKRSGALVLRDKFKCPLYTPERPGTIPALPGDYGTSYSVLSEDDQGLLIREAQRADKYANQVNALQAIVKKYQEVYSEPSN